MKITMLGTGAIGYPLTFCNCDNCNEARIRKGKSIRKRASMLINNDLLIDLGPDTQNAMSMYGKDMSKIAYRPRNSKLDKSKLVENGFYLLPSWQDATERYSKELKKTKKY